MPSNVFFLRFYLAAIATAAMAFLVLVAAGLWLPAHFDGPFAPFVDQLRGYAQLGSALLFLASASAFLFQTARFWMWTRGRGPDCPSCGCLLGIERVGRWGPYRSCYQCGKNHSVRQ